MHIDRKRVRRAMPTLVGFAAVFATAMPAMALPTITSFTPGDLVISVYGDGDGSGVYTDNSASPIHA